MLNELMLLLIHILFIIWQLSLLITKSAFFPLCFHLLLRYGTEDLRTKLEGFSRHCNTFVKMYLSL